MWGSFLLENAVCHSADKPAVVLLQQRVAVGAFFGSYVLAGFAFRDVRTAVYRAADENTADLEEHIFFLDVLVYAKLCSTDRYKLKPQFLF
jgi:hypothetical protein